MSEFRRRLLMRQGEIPYQQVEYLQSNGTQYIDTLISLNDNFRCIIDFAFMPSSSEREVICGSQRGQTIGNIIAKGTGGQFYSQVGGAINLPYFSVYNNFFVTDFSKINNKVYLFFDNKNYEYFSGTVPTESLFLFASNYASTPDFYATAKIKNCQFYQNDILVRDFVPVRIGNIGYMYDKVNKQLFGNIGSGQFILGQDI